MDALIWLGIYIVIGLGISAWRYDRAYMMSMRRYPNMPIGERVIALRIAGLVIAVTWPYILLMFAFNPKSRK